VGCPAALSRHSTVTGQCRLDRGAAVNVVTLAPHEPLPAGAIDRIVTAVGRASTNIDPGCDLCSDLEGILGFYRANVGWQATETDKKGRKKKKYGVEAERGLRDAPARQQQRVDRIVATLEKFKDLTADDWILSTRHWPAVDQIIADVQATLLPGCRAFLGVGQHRSAFDVLVRQLAWAFEQYWGDPPGYTRNPVTDELRGSFIDFVEAALNEMGISDPKGDPYTRSSIADSLSRVKT
jgi:hypothetical protein